MNILFKLYLKSLQHNGKLLLNEMMPLSAEMIALLTRHEVGMVERAIRAFMQLGPVEVLEDHLATMERWKAEDRKKAGREKAKKEGYVNNGRFKEGESL